MCAKFLSYVLILSAWLSLLPSVDASPSQAAFTQCKKAKQATDKIITCSIVIAQSKSPKILERAFNRRGLAYIEVGRFADAANDFTALIRLNPTIAGYYDNRQNALRLLGRLPDALNDANTAVRLAPTYSFVYRSRGNVFYEMGRYDRAMADYARAIAISPDDAGLFIDRGKVLVKIGRIDEAIKDFSHALQISPKAIAAYRERGLAYSRLGEYRLAFADLTLIKTLGPEDEEVALALHELEGRSPPASVAPARTTPAESNKSKREQHDGFGSGFFISPGHYIVTNSHVVDGCETVQVTAGLSAPVSAHVVAQDIANDLALLKSELHSDTPTALRTGVRVGESIAAYGFPLTGYLSKSGNFTMGNVSSAAGFGDDTRILQISAPIQPGNSGGPLFDESGNIVGIVVSKLNAIAIATITNDLAQNVNFAIKSGVLINFLDALAVDYSTQIKDDRMSRADLAEYARSITVFITCNR